MSNPDQELLHNQAQCWVVIIHDDKRSCRVHPEFICATAKRPDSSGREDETAADRSRQLFPMIGTPKQAWIPPMTGE
jgi:hypothetical protein